MVTYISGIPMRIYSRFSASADYKLARQERERDREVKPQGRGRYTGKTYSTKRQGRELAVLKGGIVAQKKTG